MEARAESQALLAERFGEDADTLFADKRYGWIHGMVKETVSQSRQDRLSTSDKIDKVVTNRFLASRSSWR
jgi:ferrous iron transport protein B